MYNVRPSIPNHNLLTTIILQRKCHRALVSLREIHKRVHTHTQKQMLTSGQLRGALLRQGPVGLPATVFGAPTALGGH